MRQGLGKRAGWWLAGGVAVAILAAPTTAHGQEPFRYSQSLPAGESVWVRNLNGPIRVEAAAGPTLEVVAEKRVRRGSADAVRITAERTSGGVLVCALWVERDTQCDASGYRSRGDGWRVRDEVSVTFTVRVPAGVVVDVRTVNGDLEVRGATARVTARTTNGGVDVTTAGGAVDARTTNGNVRARVGALGEEGATLRSTNGSITLEVPSGTGARIEARTTNGTIDTAFPVTVEGTLRRTRLQGTIGAGGPPIELHTTNGSIHLRKG